MACLLGLLGMMQYLKSIETNEVVAVNLASCFGFWHCLPKKTALFYCAHAVSCMVFYDASIRKLLKTMVLPIFDGNSLCCNSICGAWICTQSRTDHELMNNPFLYWETNGYLPVSLSIKMATIAVTMLKYIKTSLLSSSIDE